MVRWYTRHDWKTKPGLRFDRQIVLLTDPHRTFCRVIDVDEDMEDIPNVGGGQNYTMLWILPQEGQ